MLSVLVAVEAAGRSSEMMFDRVPKIKPCEMIRRSGRLCSEMMQRSGSEYQVMFVPTEALLDCSYWVCILIFEFHLLIWFGSDDA